MCAMFYDTIAEKNNKLQATLEGVKAENGALLREVQAQKREISYLKEQNKLLPVAVCPTIDSDFKYSSTSSNNHSPPQLEGQKKTLVFGETTKKATMKGYKTVVSLEEDSQKPGSISPLPKARATLTRNKPKTERKRSDPSRSLSKPRTSLTSRTSRKSQLNPWGVDLPEDALPQFNTTSKTKGKGVVDQVVETFGGPSSFSKVDKRRKLNFSVNKENEVSLGNRDMRLEKQSRDKRFARNSIVEFTSKLELYDLNDRC